MKYGEKIGQELARCEKKTRKALGEGRKIGKRRKDFLKG